MIHRFFLGFYCSLPSENDPNAGLLLVRMSMHANLERSIPLVFVEPAPQLLTVISLASPHVLLGSKSKLNGT